MSRLGVAVMAGGAGARLRTVTGAMPKALAPFRGETLLRHQLARCAGLDAARTVVLASARRGADLIAAHVPGCEVLVEPSPLGTAGGLVHLPADIDRWLVVNVDHVSDVDREALVAGASGPCTAVTTTIDATIDEGVVTLEPGPNGPRITSWRERPTVRVEVTTGLYVFEHAALLDHLDGTPCDMPELVRRLMPDGVRAWHHRGQWFDAGTPDRLLRAEAWWAGFSTN
jgi:NDP-sugar pyrophosphorylase family protein